METVAEALALWRDGDADGAVERARSAGTLLGDELVAHWRSAGEGRVYDQPEAFLRFVRGGGNVELYSRLSDALARGWDATRPESLLDVGCGDGLALVPALERAAHVPQRIDLVEPSRTMLDAARAAVPGARAWNERVQSFLARSAEPRWDAAQATFSLHTFEPRERTSVLRGLRERVTRLSVAEFDVPEFAEGTPEHLDSLATRYERGVAEYGRDASLVARGFLLPVLLGQISPNAARETWEQPVAAWAAQLADAGFSDVGVEPLADYWWAPAVLITAR
ncbi:class I SAM-dependent methyltransferase [Umezawaea beigongshangensis]|uniref:class I SAM-dependent methyltransferase n=1 Tax=Umezawaea beigongshangensis TaxID=2780383 RepID=UPI0018F23DFD|nr:class I SAM-dependent methyltransferase [Umezawaea beigongshangensis]